MPSCGEGANYIQWYIPWNKTLKPVGAHINILKTLFIIKLAIVWLDCVIVSRQLYKLHDFTHKFYLVHTDCWWHLCELILLIHQPLSQTYLSCKLSCFFYLGTDRSFIFRFDFKPFTHQKGCSSKLCASFVVVNWCPSKNAEYYLHYIYLRQWAIISN